MAGFFRQLAEQVLQSTPRLHSTAALPFARVPEAAIEEMDDTALPYPRHSREGGNPVPLQPSQQSRWIPAFAGMTAQGVKVRREKKQRAAKGKKARPMRSTAKSPPLKNAAPRPLPRELPTLNALAIARLDPAATTVGDKPPQHEAPPASTKSPRRRPTVVATRMPRSPSRPKPATPRKAVAASAPEVHIHIGRIELTATPTAAPKRESAPMKKPMSLDEYLRQKAAS